LDSDLNGRTAYDASEIVGRIGHAILRRSGHATASNSPPSRRPPPKPAYLEIADVRDYARVKLKGKSWKPTPGSRIAGDITGALKAGNNALEIQVYATPPAEAVLAVRPRATLVERGPRRRAPGFRLWARFGCGILNLQNMRLYQ
jgi:hypothetical protein